MITQDFNKDFKKNFLAMPITMKKEAEIKRKINKNQGLASVTNKMKHGDHEFRGRPQKNN